MGWEWAVYFLIALFVVVAMAPKPQSQPPAGLKDIQAPIAEEGAEIAVLFGTREMKGPNVIWYGDFESVPVQKKGGKK
jgi:hypothetical protein